MPLLWGKTRCPICAGWEERITGKVKIAGVAGAAVGSAMSILQQQPLVRYTASSTASFVLLAACFGTLQETSRLIRCADSPVNSMLAGAGTGSLIYTSHGRPVGRGAAVYAGLAGAVHWALQRVDAAGGLRDFLISIDLLDPPPGHIPASVRQQQQQQAAEEAEAAQGQAPLQRPWWHDYLPVKKLSDAEWREYKAQQDEVQQARIEAALAGGLPAMIQRRQQEEQQQHDEQQQQQQAQKGR